jgi:predicted KAP-like P-loop ATPase
MLTVVQPNVLNVRKRSNAVWPDSETDVDFINFGSVAESVAELIEQAASKPLSIGVSGAWGVGKSSLIKLTRQALSRRQPSAKESPDAPDKYVFVEFNAWLYQGYDDARAALMESIAAELAHLAEERQTGVDKTREFLGRIDWFRAASLTAGSAVALALGLPPVGLIGQFGSLQGRAKKSVDTELIDDTQAAVTEAVGEAKGLIKDRPVKEDESPRQKIQALRDSFEAALTELDVTLVVLIDDLDRCLPETAVSTLEAIRLFLFLEGTAFVIAADDQMIKHAVRKHFDGPDESLVTNYFDKLIQIPIRVPTLGTQEVRAYMFLLYVQGSELEDTDKETIRRAVCERLSQSWKGLRIDRAFVQSLDIQMPADLVAQLDTADRLTGLMTTATGISGNPRLIKRFLNTLAVRMAVSRSQGINVDEAALAKLLLFERLAPHKLYAELAAAINNSVDGKPEFLAELESGDSDGTSKGESGGGSGEAVDLPEQWSTGFPREWLLLPPKLGDLDMRGALYVSREHLPVITADDGLSSAAAEVLTALLDHPDQANALVEDLNALSLPEHQTMLDKLLDRARQEEQWGVPEILEALLVLTRVAPSLAGQLSGFLGQRPAMQIAPSIVPKINDEAWSTELFACWAANPEVSSQVKLAIEQRVKRGNVAK